MPKTDTRKSLAHITLGTLGLVQSQFDRYIIFPSDESRDAAVLWAMHAHVFRSFDASPRLSVRSREPGSGKSRVLEVLEHLVPSPMNAAAMTPGVMWRLIEHGSPTMLIDEADTIFGANGSSSSHRELRGIINAGHRASAVVPRCVGAEDVKSFRIYSPVALAGIGRLPETIATRSVEIVMRKRQAGDPAVEPFRLRFARDGLTAAKKSCEAWALLAAEPLTTVLPDLPVSERAADVWEPLVAIADLAGPEWGDRARTAALRMTADSADKPESVQVRLLRAIKDAFGADTVLSTTDLMGRLYAIDESTWIPGIFTSRDLARHVKEYGIASKASRIGGEVVRGYKAEQFQNTWSKHLS